jgi:hypothetical protein
VWLLWGRLKTTCELWRSTHALRLSIRKSNVYLANWFRKIRQNCSPQVALLKIKLDRSWLQKWGSQWCTGVNLNGEVVPEDRAPHLLLLAIQALSWVHWTRRLILNQVQAVKRPWQACCCSIWARINVQVWKRKRWRYAYDVSESISISEIPNLWLVQDVLGL